MVSEDEGEFFQIFKCIARLLKYVRARHIEENRCWNVFHRPMEKLINNIFMFMGTRYRGLYDVFWGLFHLLLVHVCMKRV